jgi:hypothetical protein
MDQEDMEEVEKKLSKLIEGWDNLLDFLEGENINNELSELLEVWANYLDSLEQERMMQQAQNQAQNQCWLAQPRKLIASGATRVTMAAADRASLGAVDKEKLHQHA